MRAGRMPLSTTAAVAALFFCVCLAGACAADVLSTPLCSEVHGFAGEFSDHLHIPIAEPLANGEAIVLVARAFPLNLGSLTQDWLQIVATYKLSAGAEVTLHSDDNGILVISDVARGSELEVRMRKLRKDGPVPFRFFSMIANSAACFVAVAPDNAFHSPLPPQVRVTDGKEKNGTKSATFFFKTTVPQASNAAVIRITEEPAGHPSLHSLAEDQRAWVEQSSGDLIQTSDGGTILFSYTPEASGATEMVLVTITTEPGEVRGGSTRNPASVPDSGPVSGSPSPESVPPMPEKKDGSAVGDAFKTVVILALLVFAAYMLGCTYYNIRVKGMRDFPEMIPLIDQFRALWRAVQLCFARVTGRRPLSHHSGQYDSLDDQDFYK